MFFLFSYIKKANCYSSRNKLTQNMEEDPMRIDLGQLCGSHALWTRCPGYVVVGFMLGFPGTTVKLVHSLLS